MEVVELEKFEDLDPWIKKNIKGSNLLYRGQSNHEWGLETTLEREFGGKMAIDAYYRRILIAQPQIETFTGEKWNLPDYSEYESWVQTCKSDSINFSWDFPGYEFMAYLRHHGYPSPLLDWSKSPFVAAFFAFRHAKKGKVSIYAYSEYPNQFKSGQSGKPLIKVLGPYIKSHKRHFQQQSWYTISAMIQPPIHTDDPYYANHESVFSTSNNEQDALWKFNIPASESLPALRHLNRYNLNAFSLFGSEESLCETLAYRAFKD
jgi:hypothetical protein